MQDELLQATSAVAKRLLKVLADPELRSELRHLAEVILETIPATESAETHESADEQVPTATTAPQTSSPPSHKHKPHLFEDQRRQNAQASKSIIGSQVDSQTPAPQGAATQQTAKRLQAEADQKRNEPVVTASEAQVTLFPSHNEACEVSEVASESRSKRSVDAIRRFDTAHDTVDLPLIVQRLTLKSEGARWSAERRRLARQGPHTGADITQGDRNIIERARDLEGCYLWMNNRTAPEPSNLDLFEQLGGAFEVCADAVALMHRVTRQNEDEFRQLVEAAELLAEAQSMLRTAVLALPHDSDSDQIAIFRWLRELCRVRRIKIGAT